MAEIAQPYEEARTSRDIQGPRVSFSELVEAWSWRDEGPGREERYREVRAQFERDHGEIVDAYLCERSPMAVALTVTQPKPKERLLLGKERWTIYTETERLIRSHPEVAPVLHRAEVQYVSVRNALRGLSQRLLVNWLFVWMRDLMISAAPEAEGAPRPLDGAAIERHNRELDAIAADYEQAASREARIVYLGGMLTGVLVLCALMVPIGILLAGTDAPVDMTTFFGCLIAGALGALVSVVTRMSADKFQVRHEVGRSYIQRLGAFRPFIGSVFGLLVYFALAGDVIRQIAIPPAEDARFAFFLVLAFTAGFSERLVKEVLRTAEGDGETQTLRREPLQVELIQPGTQRPGEAPAGPRAGE